MTRSLECHLARPAQVNGMEYDADLHIRAVHQEQFHSSDLRYIKPHRDRCSAPWAHKRSFDADGPPEATGSLIRSVGAQDQQGGSHRGCRDRDRSPMHPSSLWVQQVCDPPSRASSFVMSFPEFQALDANASDRTPRPHPRLGTRPSLLQSRHPSRRASSPSRRTAQE